MSVSHDENQMPEALRLAGILEHPGACLNVEVPLGAQIPIV